MPGDFALPISLVLKLCLGAPHCVYSRPVFFATWADCAKVGASAVDHSRRVALGAISFTCSSIGH